ncbi:methyltransferase domain-containing protein [Heliobacterium gestii]|uniref:Methyltransferase domain-containing protein n=1 Tax=Heliomicrobium gestii TaxID=2699 RepID=A0A845L6S8_HELGE|nr:class I SAM-dependent methyltransferase [Heliomicrobium gestii]MBM7866894.1 SAM-dependent methyltransferase [Heliomicrobium gestii]MZP42322.1 methyltransferase domain-containing protein [Heliomicrobium gestii]
MYELLAGVYDRLMADVNYDEWVDFTEGVFARFGLRPATVLDLACGTGAITERLLKRGYRVVGVDLSPDMLAVCADRQEEYLERGQLLLLNQDMRRLEYPRQADAIVCFLDGLNYLPSKEDLTQTLKGVAAALAPGGVLVADLHTEHKLATVLGNETFTEVREDLAYIWSNDYDADTRTVEMNLLFFVSRPDGLYERFEESHYQIWHTREEIESAVVQAGLTVEGLYGDLAGNAPTATSERFYLVARKTNS